MQIISNAHKQEYKETDNQCVVLQSFVHIPYIPSGNVGRGEVLLAVFVYRFVDHSTAFHFRRYLDARTK